MKMKKDYVKPAMDTLAMESVEIMAASSPVMSGDTGQSAIFDEEAGYDAMSNRPSFNIWADDDE